MIIGRPRRETLGRFCGYNQFPLHYKNIVEMAADLPRIKNLNFTHVWVNPLFEPCQNIEWVEQEILRGSKGTNPFTKDIQLHSEPGSPYATRSLYINSKLSAHAGSGLTDEVRKERDYADVKNYTDAARTNGLTPMYDFVMRHVAVDNPLVKEKPHWFKRHANGNFVFFGRDENYRTTKQSWDDVLEFNYDAPLVRQEIVEQYLKPLANVVFNSFGFEGLRVDAAGKIPREVYAQIIPHVDKLCMTKFDKPAIIIGETLAQNISEFSHLGGYMDYVYNSIYFQPFSREFWLQDNSRISESKGILQDTVGPTVGFAGNHDVVRLADYYVNKNHIRGDLLKQAIIAGVMSNEIPLEKIINIFEMQAFTTDQLEALVAIAKEKKIVAAADSIHLMANINSQGKISQQHVRDWFKQYPPSTTEQGNALFEALIDTIFSIVKHEKSRIPYEWKSHTSSGSKPLVGEGTFIQLIPDKLDERRLRRLMLEAFCFTAFASDGGHFFSLGDEWGVTKRTCVFTASPEDLKERAYPNLDFSEFIRDLNTVITQLPPPSNPEWVQRCYLHDPAKDQALCSFLIHQGVGFSNPGHLVIANVSDEKQIVDYDAFMEIKDANGRNSCPEKNGLPSSIYLCGEVYVSQHLRTALESKGIKIFEAKNHNAHETIRPAQEVSISADL